MRMKTNEVIFSFMVFLSLIEKIEGIEDIEKIEGYEIKEDLRNFYVNQNLVVSSFSAPSHVIYIMDGTLQSLPINSSRPFFSRIRLM